MRLYNPIPGIHVELKTIYALRKIFCKANVIALNDF